MTLTFLSEITASVILSGYRTVDAQTEAIVQTVEGDREREREREREGGEGGDHVCKCKTTKCNVTRCFRSDSIQMSFKP